MAIEKRVISRLILLTIVLLILAGTPVSASITGFVAEDDSGNYYEYSYDELLDSYALKILGLPNGLFEDFIIKKPHALFDSIGGYIDYRDVVDQYASALLRKESFNLHSYTESANAKKAQMADTVKVVKLVSGKIALAEKVLVPGNTSTTPANNQFSEKTTIQGSATVSVEQAQLWAVGRQAHQRFIDIAPLYWAYGRNMGLRPEVLYAQAAIETNFGKYDNRVPPEYNNWAGIKIVEAEGNSTEDHEAFDSPEEGVRAHYNHMAAYVGIGPFGEPHGRYHIALKQTWAGSVVTVEDLSGKWTSSLDYHVYIITLMEQMYATVLPGQEEEAATNPGSDGNPDVVPAPNPDPAPDSGSEDSGEETVLRSVAVNVEILRLRSGPGIEHDILDRLPRGMVLEVSGNQNEWLKITTPDQKKGWVHGDYVVDVGAIVDAFKGKTIVIDPGHGGSDPGAVGVTRLQEKVVNLAVAQHLVSLLQASGANVIVTRSGDQSVSNQQRVDLTNRSGADLFVSIHSNAFSNPVSNGTETHYSDRNGYSTASKFLAQQLQRELLPALGLRDRGVKASNFFILTQAKVPAALVELGFLTNPTEEALLRRPEVQVAAAEALYRGIEAYLHHLR